MITHRQYFCNVLKSIDIYYTIEIRIVLNDSKKINITFTMTLVIISSQYFSMTQIFSSGVEITQSNTLKFEIVTFQDYPITYLWE